MTQASTVLERRLCSAGEKVFSEGDAGDSAYLVDAGRVAIYKRVGDKKLVLATLVKGAIFGEMAVVDGSPRMASAVALETSVLVIIPRQLFQQKLEGVDPFSKALLTMLIDNLRNVHKVYMARPRTIGDLSRTLKELLDTQARFTAATGGDQFSPEVARQIGALIAAIEHQLAAESQRPKERRHDAVPPPSALPD